jgi:hypothetical protein
MKTIIVYKGGGAKGLIQVSCAAELAKQGIDFNNPDLHVGTSVGSINAAAFACGMTPENLAAEYPAMLDIIFKGRLFPLFPKYDRKNFITVWNKFFQPRMLKDVNSKLIITSVDRRADMPHFFKSWEDKDGQLPLTTALCRSFAAPYYFGQMNDPDEKKVWIDGGCGIDNLPLEYAFIEADLQGWLSKPVTIIALGTGYTETQRPYEEVAKEGIFEQLKDFINLPNGGMARVMSSWAQLDRIKKLCEKHKNLKFLYYDIKIPEAADGMDKLKYKSEYIAWGKEMAKKPLIEV